MAMAEAATTADERRWQKVARRRASKGTAKSQRRIAKAELRAMMTMDDTRDERMGV